MKVEPRAVARFETQVAVVTGGASGIGAAVARMFVGEGGAVVIADLNSDRLHAMTDELGERCVALDADMTVETDVERTVGTAFSKFGRLDVGFNVAGIGNVQRIVEMDRATWDNVLGANLTGVMLGMKYEARQLLAQGHGGAIVNVASLNSIVPMHMGSAYCATKAGVAMLSQCGALELGEAGIRVNTVSPGLTRTPLTQAGLAVDEIRDAYLERIPLGTVGEPEQIAAAAAFLASREASYVSGINLIVDGAWATTGYPDLRFMAERQAAR
ncbi:SDR family NAD(P)-dependent oxidoreductase [Sciscionella marina]|uniref:SDR family NAD(P)-dependent oxidoreductase n=1 Tax=Sciscionella marina TaxID=508770 RepID=UPI000399C725|nr:SDR family oxidoreductase [Sciscionella marina]